jgi:hypothetical protein
MQPNTFVGLNTGRPESLRSDTLRSLNQLGREYKVEFESRLLHMNPLGWEQYVADSKIAAVRHFQDSGYRVFAVVDNEPENLRAIFETYPQEEILLLHANTIFESKRKRLPARAVSGKLYDLTELIHEKALPRHIQFVWHGVNDEANLRQFLASSIQWAECDVRLDSARRDVILRHDSFDETPLQDGEEMVYLREMLGTMKARGKSVKLDLKENGLLVEKVLDLLEKHRFENPRLWFNAKAELLGEMGFRRLNNEYPSAILQCPIDRLAPYILKEQKGAKDKLRVLRNWGINRVSLKWTKSHLRLLLDRMDRLGFEVNIYDVPDLETFLKTVLLMPRSITSDFNFPKWYYFGKGSGQKHEHYEYTITKVPLSA